MEKLYKYPKTPHMPFSETITSDDKKLNNMNHFNNREIVITEKMDGRIQLYIGTIIMQEV